MDPVKLDEIRKKRKAERMAQLKELEAELQKLKEERSLPGAKVIDGAPNKLSKMEKLRPFLAEAAKKERAALREAYINREPSILRLNSQEDPCCTAEPKLNLSGLFREKLHPFLAEAAKEERATLREAYSNREPPILRLNSQEDTCFTAASPPAFSEDGEGKEA